MAKLFKSLALLKMIKPEKITAIAAIIISVCALITTVYQTYILEQQKHAAVWPRLTLLHSWMIDSEKSHYRITLENVGIGPAIIEEVSINYNDKSYDSFRGLALSRAQMNKISDSNAYSDNRDVFPDLVISQQDKWVLLEIDDHKAVSNFVEAINDLDIHIIYTSIYGKRFQVNYPFVAHLELSD